MPLVLLSPASGGFKVETALGGFTDFPFFYCRNRLSAYGIRFTSRCPTILHPNLRPNSSGHLWRRPKNGNKGYGKWGKFHTLSFIFCRPRLLKWQKRLAVSAANTECWWTRFFYCRNRPTPYGIRLAGRSPTILHPNLRPNSPGHLWRRPKNDTVCRKGAKKRGKSSKILQKRRQKN